MEQLFTTIIAIIGAYGICHLLVHEDGPYNLLTKLRKYVKPFRCVPCSVVYIAIPIALYANIGILGYLAIVGGVIFIDRKTEW